MQTPEHIDRATLPIYGIARLEHRLPAVAAQTFARQPDQLRMVRIECALQPVTPPQHRALESSVHRPEDSPERPQSHARKPTTLDVGEHEVEVREFDRWQGEKRAGTSYRMEEASP